MEVIPKNFDFQNIIGISENQLNQHYQLYLGYISSLNKIIDLLKNENLSSYEYRGLKNSETYSLNGIILHELYFSNLKNTNSNPDHKLETLIRRDFGNFNDWIKDFIKCGANGRGWAILAYNYRDQRLHNIMQDTHNYGSVWESEPLLVLDVYEHAYMIDFGINKDKYLNIFRKNINWQIVNRRLNNIFPYV